MPDPLTPDSIARRRHQTRVVAEEAWAAYSLSPRAPVQKRVRTRKSTSAPRKQHDGKGTRGSFIGTGTELSYQEDPYERAEDAGRKAFKQWKAAAGSKPAWSGASHAVTCFDNSERRIKPVYKKKEPNHSALQHPPFLGASHGGRLFQHYEYWEEGSNLDKDIAAYEFLFGDHYRDPEEGRACHDAPFYVAGGSKSRPSTSIMFRDKDRPPRVTEGYDRCEYESQQSTDSFA